VRSNFIRVSITVSAFPYRGGSKRRRRPFWEWGCSGKNAGARDHRDELICSIPAGWTCNSGSGPTEISPVPHGRQILDMAADNAGAQEPKVRRLAAGGRGIRISGPTFKRTTVRRARLSFFFGPSYTGCHRFSSPRMTTSSSRHRKVFLLVPRREETREGLRPFGCVGAMAKRGSRGTW
jgi:hypothetical protein